MMVWAADGLLDGALREEVVAPAEVRRALSSVWRAILSLLGESFSRPDTPLIP
jgi:hypothetical protein